jgi:aldose 1-epimerase
MKLISLQNDWLRLRIAPDLGASPVEFSLRSARVAACPDGAPEFLPIMRPTSEAALAAGDSARFSSYTLAPYCNRIRDGRMRFLGRDYPLRPNWPDGQTIHGDVRMRPFSVEEIAPQTLRCTYDSRCAVDPNFPVHYRLLTTYALVGSALHIDFSLHNTDDTLLPYGLGIHPYFVRWLWPGAADPLLRFVATSEYAVDEHIIPTGPARPLSVEHDFLRSAPAYARRLDCVFAGWDGQAELTWPGTGVTLRLAADRLFRHFVVYNGDPDGTLALEPVSQATDACNLAERGVAGTGLQVLPPGGSQSARITLSVVVEGEGKASPADAG